MNISVTSREQLLIAAKEIAYKEGISQINIRRIAGDCKIAVGSVYNYFPTKGDLVLAVIEDFWKNAFHGIPWNEFTQDCFPEFYSELYGRFYKYLNKFETDWLEQLSMQEPSVKLSGKKVEAEYFIHIQRGLKQYLEQDKKISSTIWTAAFTKELFVQFAFRNMISMLKSGQKDCMFFKQVMEKLLYQ